MLIVVLIGFLLFCVCGWWLIISEVTWIERTLTWCSGQIVSNGRPFQNVRAWGRKYFFRVIHSRCRLSGWVSQHQLHIAISVVLIGMPLMWSIIFAFQTEIDVYEDSRYQANPQISAILHGEQLVPPSALSPELFVSAEVAILRPMLGAASREWSQLKPDFTQRLLTVFKVMREQYGYEMVIIEGYRSPERQAMLAKLGGSVTNAGPYQSYHQFGLAADCAFIRNGKLVISEKDDWAMHGYQLFGALAEDAQLTWGGRWKMMDLGHVELRKSKE